MCGVEGEAMDVENKTKELEDQGLTSAKLPLGGWYVAITHNRRERVAKFHLERLGYETYLPMRDGGMVKGEHVTLPFLPGYIFVRIDLAKPRWQPINSTIGVSRLLCANDKPRPVPDSLIARIRDREVYGLVKLNERKDTPTPWKKGDAVKVKDLDADAIFDAVDKNRAWVFLALLGRHCRASVPLAQLS